MLNTSNTRYEYRSYAPFVWVLDGWQDFISSVKLKDLDDFISLQGEIVDQNRRSQVHKLKLGPLQQTFYLKIHKDFVKRSWKTLFRAGPILIKELKNIMHYARAGFDVLEPVAWGWRPRKGGGDSFMLVAELEGYKSLQDWVSVQDNMDDHTKIRAMIKSVAGMVHRIHESDLAHVDLFSWHVFLKPKGADFEAHPIDLERTEIKDHLPWSSWRIRRKQAFDLAALHLTVPWPQVSLSERMRFFLYYRGHNRLRNGDKRFLRTVLKIASSRGKHSKFKPYGIADKFRKLRQKT
jgi:hypothetical protein